MHVQEEIKLFHLALIWELQDLLDTGATQEIIEETNGGWSVDPRNDKGMSDSIRNIYRLWYDKALDVKIADRKVLSKYSRRELAGQLARVFDSVVNK